MNKRLALTIGMVLCFWLIQTQQAQAQNLTLVDTRRTSFSDLFIYANRDVLPGYITRNEPGPRYTARLSLLQMAEPTRSTDHRPKLVQSTDGLVTVEQLLAQNPGAFALVCRHKFDNHVVVLRNPRVVEGSVQSLYKLWPRDCLRHTLDVWTLEGSQPLVLRRLPPSRETLAMNNLVSRAPPEPAPTQTPTMLPTLTMRSIPEIVLQIQRTPNPTPAQVQEWFREIADTLPRLRPSPTTQEINTLNRVMTEAMNRVEKPEPNDQYMLLYILLAMLLTGMIVWLFAREREIKLQRENRDLKTVTDGMRLATEVTSGVVNANDSLASALSVMQQRAEVAEAAELTAQGTIKAMKQGMDSLEGRLNTFSADLEAKRQYIAFLEDELNSLKSEEDRSAKREQGLEVVKTELEKAVVEADARTLRDKEKERARAKRALSAVASELDALELLLATLSERIPHGDMSDINVALGRIREHIQDFHDDVDEDSSFTILMRKIPTSTPFSVNASSELGVNAQVLSSVTQMPSIRTTDSGYSAPPQLSSLEKKSAIEHQVADVALRQMSAQIDRSALTILPPPQPQNAQLQLVCDDDSGAEPIPLGGTISPPPPGTPRASDRPLASDTVSGDAVPEPEHTSQT